MRIHREKNNTWILEYTEEFKLNTDDLEIYKDYTEYRYKLK